MQWPTDAIVTVAPGGSVVTLVTHPKGVEHCMYPEHEVVGTFALYYE